MSDGIGPTPSLPAVTEPVLDIYLSLLMEQIAADDRNHVPVTLTMSSGVVYGELISHGAWKAEWARALQGGRGNGVDLMVDFPESVDGARAALVASGELEDVHHLPRWVHLREVTIAGVGHGPISMPFWRGRLGDVAGWSVGRPA
ncbi:hypothetical protein [Streptomyces sp. NPDC001194]|uniref:hypothetical protein n=1 Tax=Streptomyces sp. NPDC001194 TaxID=3364547 RepID=UPI003673D26A